MKNKRSIQNNKKMKERKKKKKKTTNLPQCHATSNYNKHRAVTETLGRYRNIKPLQKRPTVTATPSRGRNTEPLLEHQAVAETQNRFRNTKLFSGQMASLNKRISSARRVETSVSRAGLTCARLKTIMLFPLSLYCETVR